MQQSRCMSDALKSQEGNQFIYFHIFNMTKPAQSRYRVHRSAANKRVGKELVPKRNIKPGSEGKKVGLRSFEFGRY